jgi:hypothetical protein
MIYLMFFMPSFSVRLFEKRKGNARAPIVGDITGEEFGVPDGGCDMRDVGFAAMRFGLVKSDPLWSDHADITGEQYLVPDDTVNMRDIGLIASRFGEGWP